MDKTFLIVAAHPDDEILGCGASAARLVDDGWTGYALILGRGKGARGERELRQCAALQAETEKARRIIGLRQIFSCDFPDNAFDSVPLLGIVREVECIKEQVQPSKVFTHYPGDLNIDHAITFRAVLTATRPMLGEPVREILSFEIPSSTEWSSFRRETVFVPNVFIDVSATLQRKLDAMASYVSELRQYPHPRSLEYLREHAGHLGARVGINAAEGFELIRNII